jgi:cellulose biosynthesis protein BcsQ
MGIIIANEHFKGGSGKSATTFELAPTFAVRSHKVLVVDADPQGTLTEYLTGKRGKEQFADDCCITALLDDYPDPAKVIHDIPSIPNLRILPSNENWGRTLDIPPWKRPLERQTREQIMYLHDFLEDQRRNFDLVLIDTPPLEIAAALMGMATADHVLTPCQPTHADVLELEKVARFIALENAERDPDRAPLEWLALILFRVLPVEYHYRWCGELKGKFAHLMLCPEGSDQPIEVKNSVAFQVAGGKQTPLALKPNDKGAKLYAELAAAIARRLGFVLGEPNIPTTKKTSKEKV